jgi:hypothetical protein
VSAFLTTVAAAVISSAPSTARGAEPVLTVAPLNAQTTLLLAPASGRTLVAIDTGGGLLIVNQSPSLAFPLTDPTARTASGVTLLTGLR